MQEIINKINQLRKLSGNEQLNYLEKSKSDLLKQVLEYTYDPDKMYKIDKGKIDKINISKGLIPRKKKVDFKIEDWNKFTEILDNLTEKRSATDLEVRNVKYFITDFTNEDVQNFLYMVLFKDLRLNLGIKKIQTIWSDFCDRPSLQLAENYTGQEFTNGRYSRKFDGKRMYIKDNIAYSRSNKPCKINPIKHILNQLETVCQMTVFDGEVLYFDKDGNEDFQKAISVTSSDDWCEECSNLYYVIFDAMPSGDFESKKCIWPFQDIYRFLLEMFDVTDGGDLGYSVLKTKYPNILIARQDPEIDRLDYFSHTYNWEGIMYRNADAKYQFKRTKNVLKIKSMKDGEFKLVSLSQGTGKNENRLGSLNIIYKDSFVGVGSGFCDNDRKLIWDNSKRFLSRKFLDNFKVKVQYFEETVDANGNPSLRFPVFICFRHTITGQEYTTEKILEELSK